MVGHLHPSRRTTDLEEDAVLHRLRRALGLGADHGQEAHAACARVDGGAGGGDSGEAPRHKGRSTVQGANDGGHGEGKNGGRTGHRYVVLCLCCVFGDEMRGRCIFFIQSTLSLPASISKPQRKIVCASSRGGKDIQVMIDDGMPDRFP